VKNLHRGHVSKSFGLKELPDESNNHTLNENKNTFASLTIKKKPKPSNEKKDDDEEEKEEEKPVDPVKSEKKSLFDRLPISRDFKPRARFRNFSHISEFGNGLEVSTKSKTNKRDKIDEFLEKKRERNTSKRLFGRNKKNFD